jgi:hypothetical protein
VKPSKRHLRTVEDDKLEVVDPTAPAKSFLSFRYSYTEISANGASARIKSKKLRFEDGKLAAETFEADLPLTTYGRMVGEAQRFVLGQTLFLLRAFGSLLPFASRTRGDRD